MSLVTQNSLFKSTFFSQFFNLSKYCCYVFCLMLLQKHLLKPNMWTRTMHMRCILCSCTKQVSQLFVRNNECYGSLNFNSNYIIKSSIQLAISVFFSFSLQFRAMHVTNLTCSWKKNGFGAKYSKNDYAIDKCARNAWAYAHESHHGYNFNIAVLSFMISHNRFSFSFSFIFFPCWIR